MPVELNLTRLGEQIADVLISFEDRPEVPVYYEGDPKLDTSGSRWTYGNDAVIMLAGEWDGNQTVAPSKDPVVLRSVFGERMSWMYDTGAFPVPPPNEYMLDLIWGELLQLGYLSFDAIEEADLCDVPEL